MKKVSFLFLILLFSISSSAQDTTFKEIILTEPVCVYTVDENPNYKPKLEKLRKSVNTNATPCSNFVVDYIGFTPEAQVAFQHAVDIWSRIIESPVTIRVEAKFEALAATTLGSASPATLNSEFGTPGIDFSKWYPSALFEKIIGQDRNKGQGQEATDIVTRFNSNFDFYFGLDGNPPSNKIDFVTIVLHELGHGLGMVSQVKGFASIAELRSNNRSSIYDDFIVTGNNISVINIPDFSKQLLDAITSDNLFCNSPSAVSKNNGVMPKIYAPSPFNQGSSYSHWDENTYGPGNANSLMTPRAGRGEAIHHPGEITLGFLKDMGWSICSSLSVDDVNFGSTINSWPNPFTDQITLSFGNVNSTSLEVKLIDMKGSVIFSKKYNYDGSNSIKLNNMGHLESGIYIISISDTASKLQFVEKIIKY